MSSTATPAPPEHDPSRSPDEGSESVCRALLQRIVSEALRPGERLGSERALALEMGVSRGRLRRALDVLEAEGTIQRWLGRTGGVTVNDARIRRNLNLVEGVPEMVLKQGMTVSTLVVGVETGPARVDEARSLGLDRGEEVVRIERVRSVEGAPWSLDLSVLPAARFPGISALDLRDSVYGVMARAYGVTISTAEESMVVAAVDERRAELLGVRAGAPVLEVWRVARDAGGDPVEFAHDLFRADRTRVTAERTGTNWRRGMRRASSR